MISEKKPSAFNLPYNQANHYWLVVFSINENAALHKALLAYGMKPTQGSSGVYMARLPKAWGAEWDKVHTLLHKNNVDEQTEVALVSSEAAPDPKDVAYARRTPEALDLLAHSLWLGDAMMEDRIVCYMQPVLDKRGKVFGYEAFARVETDKTPIGGGKIIEASRALSVEYILDRHLHVKAITSFISSDLEGFLFINFVPGFIHRPEKYLEGLTESVKFHGMPPKQLVLDLTHSELPHDLEHLKAISDYCRTKGYALSLDDISSVEMAKKIVDNIRPDFIKLDIDLVRGVLGSKQQSTISELVKIAHDAGATVLAEGVETEEIHQELLRVGVDLFQGYLFSPPVAVSTLKKAAV